MNVVSCSAITVELQSYEANVSHEFPPSNIYLTNTYDT